MLTRFPCFSRSRRTAANLPRRCRRTSCACVACSSRARRSARLARRGRSPRSAGAVESGNVGEEGDVSASRSVQDTLGRSEELTRHLRTLRCVFWRDVLFLNLPQTRHSSSPRMVPPYCHFTDSGVTRSFTRPRLSSVLLSWAGGRDSCPHMGL